MSALLSEDLESIQILGLINRTLGTMYSDEDVKNCIAEAIKDGLDLEKSKRIWDAWTGQKHE